MRPGSTVRQSLLSSNLVSNCLVLKALITVRQSLHYQIVVKHFERISVYGARLISLKIMWFTVSWPNKIVCFAEICLWFSLYQMRGTICTNNNNNNNKIHYIGRIASAIKRPAILKWNLRPRSEMSVRLSFCAFSNSQSTAR